MAPRVSPRKRNLPATPAASSPPTDKRSKLDHALGSVGATNSNANPTLDLHRLLHTMETDAAPAGVSRADVSLRAELCQRLYQQHCNSNSNTNNNNNNTGVDKALQDRVERACLAARQAAAAASDPHGNDHRTTIQKMFAKTVGTAVSNSSDATTVTKPSKDTLKTTTTTTRNKPPSKQKKKSPSTTTTTNNNNNTNDIATLQAQQRHQLEDALSHMAADMKDQTAQLQSSLARQSQTLDAVHDVAEDTVRAVTDVAAATQQHVQQGWVRTVGTWTMLVTILVAFVVSVLTIQTIPRRQQRSGDTCVFFCSHKEDATHDNNNRRDMLEDIVVAGPDDTVDVESTHRDDSSSYTLKPQMGSAGAAGAAAADGRGAEYSSSSPVEKETEQEAVVVEDDIPRHEDTPEPQVSVRNEAPVEEEEEEEVEVEAIADVVEIEAEAEDNAAATVVEEIEEETEHDMIPRSEEMTPESSSSPPSLQTTTTTNDSPTRPLAATAAATGRLHDMLRLLATHPHLIHETDSNGWTLLHEAARHGRTQIVKLLLVRGSDVHQTTHSDDTALTLALEGHGMEHPVVHMLKKAMGSDVAAAADEADRSSVDGETTTRDCEVGPDGECLAVPQPPKQQQQQQQAAMGAGDGNPFKEGIPVSEDVLDATPMLDGKPFSGKDVRRAAVRGLVDQMQKYVEADPSGTALLQPDQNGWTALHLAVRSGQLDMVEMILEAGGDADAETGTGFTPMDIAVNRFGEESPMVELLEDYEE